MSRLPARVAVIIVNASDYAHRDLAECYASLCAQRYPASRFTVFLINHGITEESRRLAARLAPSVRVLSSERNLGWGGGNNQAILVALAEECDYLVMLNMDCMVEPDWLGRLVEAAEQRPGVHILQSKNLLYGTDRVHSRGNRIHYLGYGYCQDYGERHVPGMDRGAIDVASLDCFTRGWGATRWQLCRSFFRRKTWRMIRDYRRASKRLWTRTDAEIVRDFAGTLEFVEADHPLLRDVLNPLLSLYWMVTRALIVW